MKAWWLKHALTLKPQPCDTRPFLVRLLASIKPVVKFTKRGISYIGVKGGADF